MIGSTPASNGASWNAWPAGDGVRFACPFPPKALPRLGRGRLPEHDALYRSISMLRARGFEAAVAARCPALPAMSSSLVGAGSAPPEADSRPLRAGRTASRLSLGGVRLDIPRARARL